MSFDPRDKDRPLPQPNFSVKDFFETTRAVLHEPESIRPTPGPLTPAAVLVPIIAHHSEPSILLTRRPDTMPDHAGQIAFPGGKIEAGDSGPVGAAVRETQEETGMSPDYMDVLGCLPVHDTATGFSIVPVVAQIRPGFTLAPCEMEVAELFEVPLDFLMDAGNYSRHRTVWRGKARTYHAVSYRQYFIWGATAAVLVNLRKQVYG